MMKNSIRIFAGLIAGMFLSLTMSAIAMPPNYGSAVLMGTDAGGGITRPISSTQPLPVVLTTASGVSARAVTTNSLGDLVTTRAVLAINNISGVAAVISANPGRIARVNVISASGVGAVYDAATVASGVAATQVFAIPATVGTYELDWPMANGIVVNPSSSVIAVSYQ